MIFILPAASCNHRGTQNERHPQDAFDLFTEVPPDFTATTVIIPEGWHYDILFSEKTDSVTKADGTRHPAKGMHDFIGYIPVNGSSTHGFLYVNHESGSIDDHLGDGGGGTFFEVKLKDGRWHVAGDFRHIDFSAVGGTLRNCGGTVTPHNTILTAEETEPASNRELFPFFRDTSDFNGMKRFQHFGWMVEVDPFAGKAIRKMYQMGRFMHEDAYFDPDGKTVYLTDDYIQSVFFKFVAATPGDYSNGQLYAYRQSDDGESGEWLMLPMIMDSLIKIRDVAMRRGATLFVRMEWIDGIDGRIFISETGTDFFDWSAPAAMGAKPARHFEKLKQSGLTYADPFGRLLLFEPALNKMSVYLEGGTAPTDPAKNFAFPDGLRIVTINGRNYLVVNEDLYGTSLNRVSKEAFERGETYNEIYFLDLSIKNPTVDRLQRFMAAPRGCETTGSEFTPDGSTYFVSIQHPDTNNGEPFNKSMVIAVRAGKPMI